MKKQKQIRVTIPKWIAEIKGWNEDIHLEFVPLVNEGSKPITKDTTFILKEVRDNNG